MKYILLLLINCCFFQIIAQEKFNPDKHIKEITGKNKNIGVTAGYAIDGNISWSNAAGYACLKNKTPFSANTLTRIASISKIFTALAVMQLVEQNRIDLDVSIENYLPNFPQKEKGQITVRQLLAHTAGVSQYYGNKESENTIHYESLQEAMDVFIDRPLLFEPGTKYYYTTYGYVILGRIIEVVSGNTFQEYIQKNILDVADMKNTGIENFNEQYQNKSCLYVSGKRKTKEGKQNDLSNRIPGGGYYSTLNDLIKFGNALLAEKFVSNATLSLMLESEPVEYNGNKYGLGLFFYGPPPYDNLVIGHSGGQTGCTSQIMIVLSTKTVVVVLSNTSGNYPEIATFTSNLIGLSESKINNPNDKKSSKK